EAVAAGMKDEGQGVLQISPEAPWNGWERELAPLIDVGRKSGRPITFTLGAGNGGGNPAMSWRAALKTITEANDEGIKIKAQCFPRPIGMVLGLRLTANPFCYCPSYLAIKDLPLAERVAEMK